MNHGGLSPSNRANIEVNGGGTAPSKGATQLGSSVMSYNVLDHWNEFSKIVEKGTQEIHKAIIDGRFEQTVWIVCERVSRWRYSVDQQDSLQREKRSKEEL